MSDFFGPLYAPRLSSTLDFARFATSHPCDLRGVADPANRETPTEKPGYVNNEKEKDTRSEKKKETEYTFYEAF